MNISLQLLALILIAFLSGCAAVNKSSPASVEYAAAPDFDTSHCSAIGVMVLDCRTNPMANKSLCSDIQDSFTQSLIKKGFKTTYIGNDRIMLQKEIVFQHSAWADATDADIAQYGKMTGASAILVVTLTDPKIETVANPPFFSTSGSELDVPESIIPLDSNSKTQSQSYPTRSKTTPSANQSSAVQKPSPSNANISGSQTTSTPKPVNPTRGSAPLTSARSGGITPSQSSSRSGNNGSAARNAGDHVQGNRNGDRGLLHRGRPYVCQNNDQWNDRRRTIYQTRGGISARLVQVESAEILWIGRSSVIEQSPTNEVKNDIFSNAAANLAAVLPDRAVTTESESCSSYDTEVCAISTDLHQ